MIQKITLIITLLFLSLKCLGQEEIQLANKDGIKISYQLLLEDEGKKKDSYIVIINAINESESDLYYEVTLTKDNNGQWQLPIIPEEKGFTKILIRNSTGLFGNGQSIIGDQTELLTTNKTLLFEFKKGEILTEETSFKVRTGNTPLITNTFNKQLKPLDNFDLELSSDMLNGDYISSCGDIKLNINAQHDEEKGDFLLQTTNGNQFVWLRSSETTFVRENNDDITLTFNKEKNEFTYSTSDGINCNWIKS